MLCLQALCLARDIVFGAVIDEGAESRSRSVSAKAELERAGAAKPNEPALALDAADTGAVTIEALGLVSELARDDTPPRTVHQSKLRKNKQAADDQNEFNFIDADAQRGYFEKTDRNRYKDEDLDVPTYLRRGIKIKIKL